MLNRVALTGVGGDFAFTQIARVKFPQCPTMRRVGVSLEFEQSDFAIFIPKTFAGLAKTAK
jgi:hypothetical protein